MKKTEFTFCVLVLFLFQTAHSQTPSTSKSSGFECDVVIDIYNGLKEWATGKSYSGGQLLMEDKKKTLGAVTVANLNNTDGDLDAGGNDIKDIDDPIVSVGSGVTVGRNEVDLMKIVLRKRNPGASLSGTGDVVLQVPANVRIWKKSIKQDEVAVVSGEIHIPPVDLESPNTFFVEATAPSGSIRDLKFVVLYNGNSDYALATAVWVDIKPSTQVWIANSNEPVLGTDLPHADKSRFVYAVNTSWISVDGQRYGFGPYYSGQPQPNSNGSQNPHPLTGLLPGVQNKEIGGRILFEYNVRPLGAEELVAIDCARQKKARPYNLVDFVESPIPNTPINFPFEVSGDNEEANDDGNNITDEDQEPDDGFIYSADRPSSYIIDEPFSLGFKINKITFREYVRLQVKTGTLPFGNNLRGSRCSDMVEWHCVYYLRRGTSDRKLLADDASASASTPNRYPPITGNGTSVISVQSSAQTATYIVMFTKGINQTDPADDQFILINHLGEGDSVFRNGTSWTLDFNGVTVVVTEGSVPFAEDGTFAFNVFNSTAKVNEIGLGSFDVTTTP
jgi:hypothetical protein